MTPEPRHYLGLKGANVVTTDALNDTLDLLRMVWRHNAIGVILGEAGMGKTFSLQTALSLMPDIDFIWITLPTDTTARLVSQKLVEALTGEPATKIERNEVLRLKAQQLLLDTQMSRSCRRITAPAPNGDRSHAIRTRCLRLSFPIILAGGNGCWDVLSKQPMLRSQDLRRSKARPHDDERCPRGLPEYHPIYAGVDRAVLEMVNDKYCQGVFRNWAAFTLKAAETLKKTGATFNRAFASKLLQTFPIDELFDDA